MKKLFIILFAFMILIPIKVQAASEIIVMDIDSGRVIFESNSNEKRLIASITKIMTAIVTIENIDINKTIIVGDEVLKSYGTNTYISVGEKLRIKDLLYGLLLRSGNDAALTLSYSIDNNPSTFIEKMNSKAKEIGMNNTYFENPHGLDEETKNYSTAHDMALLSKYAMNNKIYRSIVETKKYSIKTNYKSYVWFNRNKLLTTYKYCTGGKNGYTPKAGKTLVATASKDQLNLTIVTLNDPDIYETHESLYNYYFSKYKNYTILDKDDLKLYKSIIDNDVYIDESFIYPLKEDEISKIKTNIKIIDKNSNRIGIIYVYLDGDLIGKRNLYVKKHSTKKKEQPFFQIIKNLTIYKN